MKLPLRDYSYASLPAVCDGRYGQVVIPIRIMSPEPLLSGRQAAGDDEGRRRHRRRRCRCSPAWSATRSCPPPLERPRRSRAEADRYFSNGCVRLEDARGWGRGCLLGKPIMAVAKRPEQDVAPTPPIPIYLTYFTATPTEKDVGFEGCLWTGPSAGTGGGPVDGYASHWIFTKSKFIILM